MDEYTIMFLRHIFTRGDINFMHYNKKGYTLIEIIVAIGIFSMLMIFVMGIFKSIMEGQRSAISSQNIQENLRYSFEVMSREIRAAKGNHSGSECVPISPGYYKVYNTNSLDNPPDSGNILYFKNKDDDCVIYATTTDNQIKIKRGLNEMIVTPDEVEIKKFDFFVADDKADAFHSQQARVTFVIEAEIKGGKDIHKQNIKMQTTVSSRYYE